MDITDIIAIICTFGFVPLTVWVANKAKLDRLKIERDMQRNALGPQEGAVQAELQALRTEIAGLRDTSTQFDVSVEQAVQRLEERITRIETKPMPSAVRPASEETQHVGLR